MSKNFLQGLRKLSSNCAPRQVHSQDPINSILHQVWDKGMLGSQGQNTSGEERPASHLTLWEMKDPIYPAT